MKGFNLTSQSTTSAGGDLDIYTLAEDSDTIVRDAVVLTVRTPKGSWYHNPALGYDPTISDYVSTHEEIRAILESDTVDMLANLPGFTLTSVEAVHVGGRDWTLYIIGTATRVLIVDVSFTL